MSDMYKNLKAILKNGGKFGAYRRVDVDDAGVITASEANWHNIVYRLKSKLSFNDNSEAIHGEAGEYLTSEQGNVERSYIINSAQFDSALLDFLQENANTKMQFFVSWGSGGKTSGANGAFECYMPLVEFKYKGDIELPGRKFDMEITILDNLTTNTPSSLPSFAVGVKENFATPAGYGFKSYTT